MACCGPAANGRSDYGRLINMVASIADLNRVLEMPPGREREAALHALREDNLRMRRGETGQ